MIRRRVLQVLAQIARADGDRAAARRAVYPRIDPLVRGFVRGRVERAVAAASFETSFTADDAHVHRLAYLAVAERAADHPDDVDAVRDAFEASVASSDPARYGATIVLLGAIALGIVAIGVAVWWAGRPPETIHTELPSSRTAWTRGGRPEAGSADVRALFGDRLPQYVVALDAARRARGGPDEAATRVQLEFASARASELGERALGRDAVSFLRAVLDQARQIVFDTEHRSAATDSHLRSVDALNAAVAARGLAYYVDAEVLSDPVSGRHRVYLSTFTVERVSFHRAGDQRVRALRLRRLDRLNFARSVLGFTRPQVQDGLVLLERVEGYLIDTVLPALGPDSRMPLADEALHDEPYVVALEHAMASDARAEMNVAIGDRAGELGALFARRRAIFDDWQAHAEGYGIQIARPRGYSFDIDRYRGVEGRVPAAQWRELRAIAAAIDDDEIRATYRRLEELFVQSVERHEVQHRLDYGSGTLEAIPEELERYTGSLRVGDRENRLAARAAAELSAYLSELARGPAIAKTNLALFVRHVLDRHAWGTAECYAALVVLEGLGRAHRIVHGPLVHDRAIDRAAVAALAQELRQLGSRALSRSAAQLWERLFGRPLPSL